MYRLGRRRPKPTCPPARTTPGIVCPPCDSAEGEGVQSAAELRHVQGVRTCQECLRCAPRVPGSPTFRRALSPPCVCRLVRRPTPACLPAPASRPASCMPSYFVSTGRVGVQSAAELRHVQGHDHGKNACGALLPCPAPRLYSRAFPNPRDIPSAAHGSYTPTSYFARPLQHAPPF